MMVQQPATAHTLKSVERHGQHQSCNRVTGTIDRGAQSVAQLDFAQVCSSGDLDAVESAVVVIIAYAWSAGRKCRAGGYL